MPETQVAEVASKVWGLLGAIAGATLRGWIGPGPWDWREQFGGGDWQDA